MPALPLTIAQRRFVAVGVVCLVAVLLAWRHTHAYAGAGATVPPSLTVAPRPPASSSTATTGGRQLVVDVVGAVRRPGLYRLREGSRVADAVARAGGLTRKADPTLVNLAAPVADGEQVLVAARGDVAGAPAAAAAAAGGPSQPVHLNSATPEELDTLPGVGPVTAQKIVAYRQQHGPFTSLDGLDAIPGIGPARIDSLRGLAVP